ncbi:hypothetical protein [uncultured Endozoicomonas sp.]|uniref:hypothetical protein n=1 Tax=uncultured Endozoicomonas sp. TaxID=432652 RepID=UPI002622F729|nr:hypothetical protein [uncultured Endozoicomonas sp.]
MLYALLRFLPLNLLAAPFLFLPLSSYGSLQCSNNRCADIIGLENQTVTLTGEDIVNGNDVIYGQQEYCTLSYTRPSSTSNPSSWSRNPFDVQMDGDTFDNRFVLTNGSSRLPVSFKWRGGAPVNGTSAWEEPAPNGLTASQQGAISCEDKPNSQAWVRFEVLQSQLSSLLPGTYRGLFKVDMGSANSLYHADVNFTVNLPRLVRISGLDDMNLTERGRGQYNDRFRQEEQFCVFVSGGGNYRIRASGGTASTTPFLLDNGVDTVPYRVRLSSDGANNLTVDPGQWITAENGSTSLDCNGSTNAKLRIVLLDEWLQDKPAGVYKGTLYLTVEPA